MSEELPRPSESAAEKVEGMSAPAVEAEEDIARPGMGGGKRLTQSQWHEIETHWEYGTMKAVDIIKEYDVTGSALTRHFKHYGIVRNSKAHLLKKGAEVKIAGAVAAAEDPIAVSFEQKRKGRIAQTRETFINQSAAIGSDFNKIKKQTLDGTRTNADAANEFKSLRHQILAAERIMDARLRCLNADAEINEESMPTLIFRDLSEEEITAMANADDNDELGIEMLPESAIEEIDDEIVEEGVSSPPSS